ncbi:MAG: hypothetical protein HZB21_02785 [Deltaproteobacteria bacterium]|nr:hypothetical protein [Deltaproteobacteria bacterium]
MAGITLHAGAPEFNGRRLAYIPEILTSVIYSSFIRVYNLPAINKRR